MSWSFSSSSRAAFFRAAGPAAVVADWPASSPLPELPSGKRAIWSSGVKAGVDFEALPVRKLFASGTSAAPRSSTAIEMAGQFGIRTRAGRTRRLPVFYDAETPVNRYPEDLAGHSGKQSKRAKKLLETAADLEAEPIAKRPARRGGRLPWAGACRQSAQSLLPPGGADPVRSAARRSRRRPRRRLCQPAHPCGALRQ